MEKVVIWGTGQYATYIFEDLLMDKCVFEGFVDNAIEKKGKLWRNQYRIYSLEKSIELDVDFYLVSAMYYKEQIIAQAKNLGIENKLIWYWQDNLNQYEFIDNSSHLRENILLKIKIEKLQREVDNAPYEYGNSPVKIKSAKELLEKIIEKKYSLCRFGDGEFDIILNHNRAWFQKYDAEMSEKLKKIFGNSKMVNRPMVIITIVYMIRFNRSAAITAVVGIPSRIIKRALAGCPPEAEGVIAEK